MYALQRDQRSTHLSQVIDDFCRWMVREGRSAATIRSYSWALDDLQRFLRAQGVADVTDLTRRQLEDWQDEMIARGVGPRSRQLASTAVRMFVRFCADEDLVDSRLERGIARVKVQRLLPRPIPPVDLQLVKAYLLPRRPGMGLVPLRDRALFFYLLTTGARVSEALQVRRDEAERALVIQKGGSQKVLRMTPSTAAMVTDYLEQRHDHAEWLWVTHDSNRPQRRLDPAAVREVWRKVARHVGVPAWTTHQLRHTCASELLEAGVPELVVAEHLGHHGLGTLHVYGQIREAQRQLAIDAMENLTRGPQLKPVILKPMTPRPRRRPA